MSLFHAGLQPALDTDGNPINLATWNFYRTETSTPLAVYSDSDLSVSLGTIVTSNSAGRFANIFLDDSSVYRAILKDASGATIKDVDPVNPAAASSASGSTPSVLDYIPEALHADILDFTSTVDVSSYFQNGWTDAGVPLLVPAGLYNVTTISPLSKTGLIGLGRQSVINQLTTCGETDSVILISGVTDVLIEGLEIRGIIAQFDHTRQNGTFPKPNNSEFNHGISIRADDAQTTERITVRNCYFKDVRGDAILVFEADAGALAEVDLFQNAGTNVLRNGIAVVGGHRGRIKGADFPICGYAVVDFESEGTYSDHVEGWTVEDIYGPVVQVAGNADTYNNRVKLRNVVTDGSLANTTPPYKNSAGVSFHDTTVGLRCRNVIRLDIDGHYPINHTGHAIFYVTDPTPTFATSPILQLKNFEYDATIGTSEAVYNAQIVWSPTNGEVYIEDGKHTAYDDNQTLLWFSGTYTHQASIKNVQTTGRLVNGAKSITFENIRADLSATRGLTSNCQRLHFINCQFLSAGSMGFNPGNIIMENSVFTVVGGGAGYGGTLGPVTLINSTFGAFSTTGVAVMNAGAMGVELTGTAVKIATNQIIGARGAAVADVASANATDLATAITLVNELKAQVNTLLARLRSTTGHGLFT
jgi:hypothetical protein